MRFRGRILARRKPRKELCPMQALRRHFRVLRGSTTSRKSQRIEKCLQKTKAITWEPDILLFSSRTWWFRQNLMQIWVLNDERLECRGSGDAWNLGQTEIKVAFSFFLSGQKLTMSILIKTFTAPFNICHFSTYIHFPRNFGRRNRAPQDLARATSKVSSVSGSSVRAETVQGAFLFSFPKMDARIMRIVSRKFLGPLFAKLSDNLIGGHGHQKRHYFWDQKIRHWRRTWDTHNHIL